MKPTTSSVCFKIDNLLYLDAHCQVHPSLSFSTRVLLTEVKTVLTEQSTICGLDAGRVKRELTAMLDSCPHAVRIHEGLGEENLIASLAVTLQAMTRQIEQLTTEKETVE